MCSFKNRMNKREGKQDKEKNNSERDYTCCITHQKVCVGGETYYVINSSSQSASSKGGTRKKSNQSEPASGRSLSCKQTSNTRDSVDTRQIRPFSFGAYVSY